jgi:hypothetical protein
MVKKTEGVKILVQDVLQTFPEPYKEDVIRDVVLAIENEREWRRRYDELCDGLRAWVVNNWIGKYTKYATGLRSWKQVPLEDGHIIKSYTKLSHSKKK